MNIINRLLLPILLLISFSLNAQRVTMPQTDMGDGGDELIHYAPFQIEAKKIQITIENSSCYIPSSKPNHCNDIIIENVRLGHYISLNDPVLTSTNNLITASPASVLVSLDGKHIH